MRELKQIRADMARRGAMEKEKELARQVKQLERWALLDTAFDLLVRRVLVNLQVDLLLVPHIYIWSIIQQAMLSAWILTSCRFTCIITCSIALLSLVHCQRAKVTPCIAQMSFVIWGEGWSRPGEREKR